jgi:outer membrane immunogenic protein
MKQYNVAASMFVSALLLSSNSFAHNTYPHNVFENHPYKGEVIVAPAPYNWTGFYAGANVGWVSHNMDITDDQATSFQATIHQVTTPRFTGGFQFGYRRQIDLTKASGVYGLEFSADFGNATFNRNYGSPFALYQLNSTNSLKDQLLLQFLGGVAADRTLLFMAAGLSWTNVEGSTTNTAGLPFFNNTSFNTNKKMLGAAIGGGIEYAFTNAFSARLKVDVIEPNNFTSHDSNGDSFQINNSMVQGTFGLNYKFA